MRSGATASLALVVVLSAGLLGAADFEKEFLGRSWGAPLSDFKGYANVGRSGKIAYYIDPQRAYSIFSAQVSDLVYGFYDDAFFAVYVNLDAINTYGTVKRRIQEKLGTPDKISMEARGDLTVYSWRTGDTRIKLKSYDTSGAMKLSFYHAPIANRVNYELKRELDAEPPEPLFPLSQTREKEAVELLDLFNY
jgi:hypothetical protein